MTHDHDQDIGYLLTAYADGQLAPEGVMWVEEQLDGNPDLRGRLKEIRQLQAGLRSAFAAGAPAMTLDLPRRDQLLAQAAHPPMRVLRLPPRVWGGMAAGLMACAFAWMVMPGSSRSSAVTEHHGAAPLWANPAGDHDATREMRSEWGATAPAEPRELPSLMADEPALARATETHRANGSVRFRSAGQGGGTVTAAPVPVQEELDRLSTLSLETTGGKTSAYQGKFEGVAGPAPARQLAENMDQALQEEKGAADGRLLAQRSDLQQKRAAAKEMSPAPAKPASAPVPAAAPTPAQAAAAAPAQAPGTGGVRFAMARDQASAERPVAGNSADTGKTHIAEVARAVESSVVTLSEVEDDHDGGRFLADAGNDLKKDKKTVARAYRGRVLGGALAKQSDADRKELSEAARRQDFFAEPTDAAVAGKPVEPQRVDPAASLLALRDTVSATYAGELADTLSAISGRKVAFTVTPAAEPQLGTGASIRLENETVARGVLRLARGSDLQARLAGGVVNLDLARRPLDPSDTQGLDLPTFKQLFGTSPMQATAADPVQTFALDADTASYSYASARIAAGQEVDPSVIRPEHFINAMPMDYPPAQGPEAFTLYAEAAPSPFARPGTAWGARTALVAIGAVAKAAAADERRPLALTLAIDCSGSMAQPGGLDRIREGLVRFVEHLRPEDRVSIVAFGDQARVVLPATPGNDLVALRTALQRLATGGATNCAEGLGLAYQLAAETAAPGVESRVLLATDGGTVAGADELLRRVTAFKERGISLVVVGCGATYRAGPLQELANQGDGQHYFVGSDEEARALFSGRLLPDRLGVLARDAKVQVTWNPQRVSHARLIGYDQRRLAAKDFRDNSVDAGELAQDTRVTALFEVLLVDGGTGQLGDAAVRYFDTRRQQVRELACPLPGSLLASQPSDRLRLLASAAATAEWLQRGWWSNVHLIAPGEIRAQLERCPQPEAHQLKAMLP
jgi:Ca-activated chloride channel family protein